MMLLGSSTRVRIIVEGALKPSRIRSKFYTSWPSSRGPTGISRRPIRSVPKYLISINPLSEIDIAVILNPHFQVIASEI